MLILGIETSCDETAASVVADGERVLSNLVASQISVHEQYGGVVPELASRKHLEWINPVIDQALWQAKTTFSSLDGVAVTQGPGLVGSLLVGISVAKSIAYSYNIPLLGVNHLEGHLYANFLEHPEMTFPFLGLVVSGGHTELIHAKAHGVYDVLGRTRDDAVGEAFDKVAKLLGLGYPGGPIIDELANRGNPGAIDFPRALFKDRETLDFSFSGLKTAVVNYVKRMQNAEVRVQKKSNSEFQIPPPKASLAEDGNSKLYDVVASFQETAVDMLIANAMKAIRLKRERKMVLAGGVAANTRLRSRLWRMTSQEGISLYYPSPELCTDNAAMIASLGYYKLMKGTTSDLSLNAVADLRLGR